MGTGRGSLRAALRVRDFRYMLTAFAVSRAGDFLYNVALVIVILQRTSSASWVAAAMLFRLIPYVVLTPFAGVISDRMDRVRLMVASDTARALLMAVLAALVAAHAHPGLLILIATVASCAGTPFLSSFMATIPQAVPEDRLAGATSLISVVEYVAMVAGPAGTAVMLLLGSDWLPFAVNSATFVVSALCVRRVSATVRRAHLSPDSDDQAERPAPPRMLHAVVEGVAVIRGDRNLAALTSCLVAITFAFGFEVVYLVLVSVRRLGTGEEGVGFLDAAVGLGGVLAVALAARLADSRRPKVVVAAVVICSAVPLALLSVISSPALAYLVLLVEGAASVTLDVVVVTTMQRVVPPDRMARVDGVIGSVAVTGTLAGTLVAPFLLAAVGLSAALVLAAAVPATVALVVLFLRARFDSAVTVADERAPLVDVLAEIPVFAGLPRHHLERLAASGVTVTVAAGTTIVREGDPADDIYVLVAGTCVVTGGPATQPLATLVAPDAFGEIGVVGRRPRTATVTAADAVTVVRVAGVEFLAAVAVGTGLSAAVSGVIAARVARSATAL